ncbi:MAG: restriction endonuclease subunit S [Acinetobacter sp.]|nr:restriction endonuclease subunit S [Acinetobacter sp.]
MAKYQKYAEYQDSGIEWLGEIPKDWEVLKLKYVLDLISEKSQDNSQKYVGMENIASKTGKYVHTEEVIPEGISNTFKENDVLFGKLRPYLAKSWLASFSGICSSELLVLRAKKVCPKFLQYYTLTDEFINQVDSSTYGSKMPRASWEFISLLPLPKCSYELSLTIANFLDHETAKIDSLIAKQEKLIELLKEKRQAMISHAVTKGLNPDVNMKDSGVEWLGQVPEHWKCIKIKHITTTFEQGWSPQCDSRPAESHEYGVLKVGCVNSGSFRSSENKALPPELEPRLQYLIQKDDLLISRANTKELVGSASVVNGDYPNLILCDKLYRLRFSKNVLPEMVSLYLSIGAVRKQIELGATGASHSMQNIGQDTIKELYYLLPPYEEALNILESIKQSNQKFDELTKKAESAIQLMQERRTALISSAVTGKIDVRNWQHPNEAKTELSA